MDLPPPHKFLCRPALVPSPLPMTPTSPPHVYQPMPYIESSAVVPEQVDSLNDWYEQSQNQLLKNLNMPNGNARDRLEAPPTLTNMLQDWIPPALQQAAEPLVNRWTPPAMREWATNIAYKSNEFKKGLQGMGLVPPFQSRLMDIVPPWRQLHFHDHAPHIRPDPPQIRPFLDAVMPRRLSEDDSSYARRLAEEESWVKRIAEATIDVAPRLIQGGLPLGGPFNLAAPRPFWMGAQPAQCPAGFVNTQTMRRQRKVEQIPDHVDQAWQLFKNLLNFSPGNIDATSVGVGLATNMNSIANKLAEWYRTFSVLPEALGGAASNLTSLSVAEDMENAVRNGVSAVKPVVDLVSNVAQQLPTLREEVLPRGSSPIFAPIANDFF
eukprot:Blabericola_migrator_1__7432@NODE_378_length_9209_cov_129_909101_g302_i0_p4_GENE_NODE_378_length_9209_cov_129_909101_g302_i0NODE_378_length_9209_cov_129_909101_g302_i0_p4_ORF_typecomplete_len380_score44_43_NODE_378_length_9209_cov_129_909101_g302_i057316870